MEKFYIYSYEIDETGEIFYIGKGCGKRAFKGTRNKFCEDMKNTHSYTIKILEDNLTEQEAFDREIAMIADIKTNFPHYRLTNQSEGGEGPSGFKHTAESIFKISKSSKTLWEDECFREKQLWHRQNGVYQSDEFKKTMSDVTKGELNGNFGNKWTDEMKAALSEKRKSNGKSAGRNNSRAVKVVCIENKTIYGTINEINDCLDISRHLVKKSISTKSNSNGYTFELYDEDIHLDFTYNELN